MEQILEVLNQITVSLNLRHTGLPYHEDNLDTRNDSHH